MRTQNTGQRKATSNHLQTLYACIIIYLFIAFLLHDNGAEKNASTKLRSSLMTRIESQLDLGDIRNNDADENCGAWSSSIFDPNSTSNFQSRTSWEESTINSEGNTIVKINWRHKRSGGPSAVGIIHASVSMASISSCVSKSPMNFNNTINLGKNIEELPRTAGIDRSNVLSCSAMKVTDVLENSTPFPSATVNTDKNFVSKKNYSVTKRTVILSLLEDSKWNEAISSNPINLWHYHAATFRFWAGLQIGFKVAKSFGIPIDPDQTWVVLLVPRDMWSILPISRQVNVFVLSPTNLMKISSHSSERYALHGLQGLSDVLGGKLVLVQHPTTTLVELKQTLESIDAPIDISLWITPPEEGLLWDLAWDQRLSQQGPLASGKCHNSLLMQYRRDIVRSIQSKKSKILRRSQPRHVCVVSRQGRGLRSLSPAFMLKLLDRLGAPMLLSPHTSLRRLNSSSPDESTYFLRVEKSSISEQVIWIYEECAVLVGVHGAGLINALGLRPGTSIVELQTKDTTYQYFRNVAALLKDVDYTLFRIQGSGADKSQEFEMYADDNDLQLLYDIIQTKLLKSNGI
jgi:hypothetical protein